MLASLPNSGHCHSSMGHQPRQCPPMLSTRELVMTFHRSHFHHQKTFEGRAQKAFGCPSSVPMASGSCFIDAPTAVALLGQLLAAPLTVHRLENIGLSSGSTVAGFKSSCLCSWPYSCKALALVAATKAHWVGAGSQLPPGPAQSQGTVTIPGAQVRGTWGDLCLCC